MAMNIGFGIGLGLCAIGAMYYGYNRKAGKFYQENTSFPLPKENNEKTKQTFSP